MQCGWPAHSRYLSHTTQPMSWNTSRCASWSRWEEEQSRACQAMVFFAEVCGVPKPERWRLRSTSLRRGRPCSGSAASGTQSSIEVPNSSRSAGSTGRKRGSTPVPSLVNLVDPSAVLGHLAIRGSRRDRSSRHVTGPPRIHCQAAACKDNRL